MPFYLYLELFVPIYLNKASFFTDLIGVIIDVGPYDFASPTSNKKLQKIQICEQPDHYPSYEYLYYDREQTQQLLLWSEHGESFDGDNIIQQSKNGIVVAIFAGLTVGNFSG
jgi:replication factor A1